MKRMPVTVCIVITALVGCVCNTPCGKPGGGTVKLVPSEPASLTVRVTGGTWAGPDGKMVNVRDGTLTFDPPEVGEGTCSGGVPKGCNPENPNFESWKAWNSYAFLPPENPPILGIFYRGILPDSIVLQNHDRTKTYTRGKDYIVYEEQGMLRGVGQRLGPPAKDRKKPQPHEMLHTSFKYYTQRLDLVQVDADGRLSVKKSDRAIMCPVLPDPDPGHTGVAGVWVYGAHMDGPVPDAPERIEIHAEDICMIDPRPPVAPLNAEALKPAVERLRAGKVMGLGFFGDSIAVGCEVRDWYMHSYSVRNKGFVGMVIRDLKERYPEADVEPAWGIVGAQSIFNGRLWSNVLRRCGAQTGDYVWREGEAYDSGKPAQPVEDLRIRDEDMRSAISEGQWLELTNNAVGTRTYAEYAIDLEEDGDYSLFVRFTSHRGRIRWQWDGGEWNDMPEGKIKPEDAEDVRQFMPLCWIDMGETPLSSGTHTLRIELSPGEGIQSYTAIDCLMVTKDDLHPWRKYKPDELNVNAIVYAMGMNGSHSEKHPRELHKKTILRHIRQAREKGAEVLLVSTMENNAHLVGDPGKSKKPNRDLMAEIAEETGAPFADLYTEWMNQCSRGIPPDTRLHNFLNHPDAVGHRLWADVILRAFDEAAD